MQSVTFDITLEDGTNLQGNLESAFLAQGIDNAKQKIVAELDYAFSAWKSVEIKIVRLQETN